MEICDELKGNSIWRESCRSNDVIYQEIKETEENQTQIHEEKLKELENFDRYKVYEEVEDLGQETIGTRCVLTERTDGTIKARFVMKGFQEE